MTILTKIIIISGVCACLLQLQIAYYFRLHHSFPRYLERDNSSNHSRLPKRNDSSTDSSSDRYLNRVITIYKATSILYGLLTDDDYFGDWKSHRAPTCYGKYRCKFVDYAKGSDAVIFHATFVHKASLDALLEQRTYQQRWIFFSWESPVNTFLHIADKWRFQFNVTATYMRRSDIYTPFSLGYRPSVSSSKHKPAPPPLYHSRKMAFVVASNCKASDRQRRILELQKYVSVDVYGNCGRTLPLGYTNIVKLSQSYYFYLAFENSQCRNYITEKFWKNALRSYSIPVVLAGTDRDDVEKVAPPNSFIHVRDFETTEDLASYMKKISKDRKQYMRYFDWKKRYDLIDTSIAKIAICNICRYLHDNTQVTTRDLTVEWNRTRFCRSDSVTSLSRP